MKTLLNKEFLEAIRDNVEVEWSDKHNEPRNAYYQCANECEKICKKEKKLAFMFGVVCCFIIIAAITMWYEVLFK